MAGATKHFRAWWKSPAVQSHDYTALMKDEVESGTSVSEDSEDERQQHLQHYTGAIIRPRTTWDRWSRSLNVVLLGFLGLLSAAYVLSAHPTDRECGNQLEVWSPIQEIVEYEEMDFDNAFAHQTIYRGPPTPELEAAWLNLWFYGPVRVPEDKLWHLNRTVDLGQGRTLAAVEDGQGGYEGMIEVFHQLHCLSLIRQYTWRDWYFRHQDIVEIPMDMLASDVGARMHVDHCIEALRITLMCHGDVTPSMRILDPTAPQGHRADFNTHHKCRKFEPIRQWAEDNQLSILEMSHHGHIDELPPTLPEPLRRR